MMGVPLVYSGLLALTLGFLSVGKPLRPFRDLHASPRRRRGGQRGSPHRLRGFVLLAEEADRELVIGALLGRPRGIRAPKPAAFVAFREAGYAKVAMNFRIEPGDGFAEVATETRVIGTDEAATRGFAAYWRVIYPGSALIRRMWQRAIKQRAEQP